MIEARSSSQADGIFNTFDVGDQACIEQYYRESGASVISHCNSENEHSAEMLLNCGKQGQSCCFGCPVASNCDSGFGCASSTNTCVAVGGIDQACKVSSSGACNAAPQGRLVRCISGSAPVIGSPGMCRDMTVERAPLITADLIIHTCDEVDAGSNGMPVV